MTEREIDDRLTAAEDAIPVAPPLLKELIVNYATARSQREAVSQRENELRKIEDAAQGALFDELERQSLRQARHETLGLFTMNDMANALVTDEAKLREWALIEMPELMLPNRQRLSKVLRDTLKEGGDLPPGTDVTFYRKINWRRGPLAPKEPTDG